MNPTFYKQLQKDAEYIAERAIHLLNRYQKTATIVVQKDRGDFAMSADLAAEKLIERYVKKKYPHHGFFGEESGLTNSGSPYVWIVDPLDGTKEYARGLEEYNCLIAVEHKGQLVAGVIHRNGTGEMYSASVGSGAWRNKKPIHASDQHDVSSAYIGYHLPIPKSSFPKKDVERHFDILKTLTYSCYRLRPGWDDAKCMAWVAQGVFDAHIVPVELKNEWYDLAPGILLVQEAGGVVTHLDGSPLHPYEREKGFIVSNGRIHEQLLSLMRKEFI